VAKRRLEQRHYECEECDKAHRAELKAQAELRANAGLPPSQAEEAAAAAAASASSSAAAAAAASAFQPSSSASSSSSSIAQQQQQQQQQEEITEANLIAAHFNANGFVLIPDTARSVNKHYNLKLQSQSASSSSSSSSSSAAAAAASSSSASESSSVPFHDCWPRLITDLHHLPVSECEKEVIAGEYEQYDLSTLPRGRDEFMSRLNALARDALRRNGIDDSELPHLVNAKVLISTTVGAEARPQVPHFDDAQAFARLPSRLTFLTPLSAGADSTWIPRYNPKQVFANVAAAAVANQQAEKGPAVAKARAYERYQLELQQVAKYLDRDEFLILIIQLNCFSK
jgi:hypothetical protein